MTEEDIEARRTAKVSYTRKKDEALSLSLTLSVSKSLANEAAKGSDTYLRIRNVTVGL